MPSTTTTATSGNDTARPDCGASQENQTPPAPPAPPAPPIWAGLSFVKWRCKRDDEYVVTDWLNLRLEKYWQGKVTGLKVMEELIALAHAHADSRARVRVIESVMIAAAQQAAKPSTEKPSKHGAATAIIVTMAHYLALAATADMKTPKGECVIPMKSWVQSQIKDCERTNAQCAEQEAIARSKRAAFLRGVREGKRQAQALNKKKKPSQKEVQHGI